MDDFSSIYEKLIDMGFSSNAVDSAIEKGLYLFDDIFNALVDKEQISSKLLVSNDVNQQNIMHSSEKTDDNAATSSEYDDHYPRLKLSDGDTMAPDDTDQNHHRYDMKQSEDSGPIKIEVGHEYNRQMQSSSSTSGSFLKSNVDSSNQSMTKIQIMDLLDPSYQPHTYSQPFLASICSVRDLICWFCHCRSTKHKVLVTSTTHTSHKSSVAIPSNTDMHTMINLFDDLKWHLVLPSGATSMRIYGRDNLDKHLDQLGLVPSAHLLAIVGCPITIRSRDLSLPQQVSSSMVLSNNSSAVSALHNDSDFCHVHIRMINYRHNPLYLHGRSSFKERYNLDNTILQKVVSDFSLYCGQDLSSFDFLQMNPSKVLSYPDDYLRSLRSLSFIGTVTLYCHLRLTSSSSSTISDWSINDYNNSNQSMLALFPGQGHILQGSSPPGRTVRQAWTDRSVASVPLATSVATAVSARSNDKSLFRLSLAVLYRALRDHQIAVCRHIRRLPNSLQQMLIRQLIIDHSLAVSTLSHFCTSQSCLVSLDLSYTSQATNEVLRVVGRCLHLQELILDNEDHLFTNDGLWYLRACVNLRRLSLNYCARISDWGLQLVGELPLLATLSLKHTGITDLGLARILAPPPLTSLDLSSTTLTDQCLVSLASFATLQIVNLASTAISDPAQLPPLPLLQHLDLSHCRHLSWHSQSHIRSLSLSFPGLTSLAVTDMDSHSLVYLAKSLALCTNLRHLDGFFNHPQMTATLIATIAHLPLHSIVLTNASHVNDLWLPVLARFSSTLDHLVLSHCHRITGANNSLLNHLSRLAHLSWLDLTHLENVDSTQITQLVLGPYFPRMQVVWFSLTEEEEFHFRSQVRETKFKINITRSLPPHHISQ